MIIKNINKFGFILCVVTIIVVIMTGSVNFASAELQDDINARNKQIEEIQKQIDSYQIIIDETNGRARSLANEIANLDARIKQVQLEIKSLGLAITQTQGEITITLGQITVAQGKIDLQKSALAQYVRILNQTDQESFFALLIKNTRLSNFFNNVKNLEDTQAKAKSAIVSIKVLKSDLEQKESDLEDKRTDLEKLKNLQLAQAQEIQADKKTKATLLAATKGQEAKYQELVKKSQNDIAAIRDQIFYLEQNGVTVEDAIKFGQLAAIRVGIRPAFLIAILEVESGLGRNVGTGNWEKDMYKCYLKLGKPSRAEAEKAAFLQIVGSLGLDPNTVKVSREPNYGCGGALGPGQFLPTTWLGYVEEVKRLTGRSIANPWNIEDAFMASAIKLAKAGAAAKTKKGETAAAKAYISGNSSCTKRICTYYANAVLNKASAIEQNL